MAQVVEILICGWQENHLSYIVNTMAADDLATQGARASSAMVLTIFSAYSSLSTKWVNGWQPVLIFSNTTDEETSLISLTLTTFLL